jgi:hypothetical protein
MLMAVTQWVRDLGCRAATLKGGLCGHLHGKQRGGAIVFLLVCTVTSKAVGDPRVEGASTRASPRSRPKG